MVYNILGILSYNESRSSLKRPWEFFFLLFWAWGGLMNIFYLHFFFNLKFKISVITSYGQSIIDYVRLLVCFHFQNEKEKKCVLTGTASCTQTSSQVKHIFRSRHPAKSRSIFHTLLNNAICNARAFMTATSTLCTHPHWQMPMPSMWLHIWLFLKPQLHTSI